MLRGAYPELFARREEFVDALRRLFANIQERSEIVSVVNSEEDDSPERQPEAATFVKLNGRRIGRDLELLGFMCDITGGSGDSLSDVAGMVLAIKRADLKAYLSVVDEVKALRTFLPTDRQRALWEAIWVDEAQS